MTMAGAFGAPTPEGALFIFKNSTQEVGGAGEGGGVRGRWGGLEPEAARGGGAVADWSVQTRCHHNDS